MTSTASCQSCWWLANGLASLVCWAVFSPLCLQQDGKQSPTPHKTKNIQTAYIDTPQRHQLLHTFRGDSLPGNRQHPPSPWCLSFFSVSKVKARERWQRSSKKKKMELELPACRFIRVHENILFILALMLFMSLVFILQRKNANHFSTQVCFHFCFCFFFHKSGYSSVKISNFIWGLKNKDWDLSMLELG